jgi:hypothetical protein
VSSVIFTLWGFELGLVCAALMAMCSGFCVQKLRGQA